MGKNKRIKGQVAFLVLLQSIAVLTCQVSMAQSFGQFKDAAEECRSRKNYAEEETYWKKALEKCPSAANNSDPRVLECLLGLAQSYQAQNRPLEAESLYKRIAAATAPGSVLNETQAAALQSYCDLLKGQNRIEEANSLEATYKLSSVAIRQDGDASASNTKLIEWNHEKFHQLISQGNQYSKQNRFQQAESYYKQALQIADSQLGAESASASEALNKLISVSYKQKKYAQAELYYARTLQIVRKHRGATSAEYAEALGAHSQLLRMLNRKGEAIAEESRAEQILIRFGLGSNNVGSGERGARTSSSRQSSEFGSFMSELANY